MAKENNNKEKLLDAWIPPQNAGEPVGFISTTFTFNASFFEEDCLGAFLQLESDPDTEGLSYIIEREEKLNKVECAMVLADQHHSKTNRNIRWDLLPVRMPNGIQHAKINLLFWTNTIRIIIGSANLTPEGYRRNQEIFSFFDASYEAEIPLDVFTETFIFLERIILQGVKCSEEVSGRGLSLLQRAKKTISNFKLKDQNLNSNKIHVWPVFTYPQSNSALSQVRERWLSYYSFLPDNIDIVSPFFDSMNSNRVPGVELNNSLLNKQGSISYYCSGEEETDSKGRIRLNAPKFLMDNNPVNCCFYMLPQLLPNENEFRPLHMKSIRLMKGNWVLLMMGSGNFTAAGMATGFISNYEANIVFITSSSRNYDEFKALQQCLPFANKIDQENITWQPILSEDGEEDSITALLPAFILSAEADLVDNKVMIRFRFDSTKKLPGFSISTESGKFLLNEQTYIQNGIGDYFDIIWFDRMESGGSENALPSGFEVSWPESKQVAWLPLNVKNYNCLPPPEHLKELPLHILLQILTSAKPLHLVLKKYFKNLNAENDTEFEADEIIDPHKRVDTSGFLLQRTRRISYAFNAIQERLSKPTGTIQSLQWKLYGPVGLQALVNAIRNEVNESKIVLPEERLFFLAELLLELSSVQPERASNCLPPKAIKSELKKFIETISIQIKKDPAIRGSWIKQYVNRTINIALENSI